MLSLRLLTVLLCWPGVPHAAEPQEALVRHIERLGVRDPGVLRVMRATPRHEFVPAAVRARAYEDTPLPIGHDATISQPSLVALMTELLAPARTQRVLEIGTGSGYQAAVLSPLVRHVYTIERVPELAQSATATLARLGHRNVTVRAGDGYRGWPDQAPFDRIILTAAPPDVPAALLEQLRPGGRLVAPVGSGAQELVVIDKGRDGTLRRRTVLPVRFVPMVPGGPP